MSLKIIQKNDNINKDIRFSYLLLNHNWSPNCLQFLSVFPNTTNGGCDLSAEDAHTSMAPDPSSSFERSVFNLLMFCNFIFWTSDFKLCSLSPHIKQKRKKSIDWLAFCYKDCECICKMCYIFDLIYDANNSEFDKFVK